MTPQNAGGALDPGADSPQTIRDSEMDIAQIIVDTDDWVREIERAYEQIQSVGESEVNDMQAAWDDVNGGELPIEGILKARKEEIGYMESRGLWHLVPIEECWNKTQKDPVSMRWVDTDKGSPGKVEIRSRLVARDFKGSDKDRDDLFAETPPLEAKRLLISRTATRRRDGRMRKMLFIDARKAHLNSRCDQDVYIRLPEEAECPEGMCGKLDYWVYGFRPAGAAWEKLYAGKFEGCGFIRGVSCGVVFYHPTRDLSCVVHGDDFSFSGLEEDLIWIRDLMKTWFEIKVRALLGGDVSDDKEVVILGRIVTWTENGIEYQADPKHRKLIMEYFGFAENTKALTHNGEKEAIRDEGEDLADLDPEEATKFRGLAARMNFLSLDCPDLQFPVKQMSREMASPKLGSWARMKKVARYILGRESVVWQFLWQDEPKYSHTSGDSDWGGKTNDRKSTSGGVWMIGQHCIKT